MSEPVNTTEAPKPGTKPYLEAQLAAEQAEKEALLAELEALKNQQSNESAGAEAPEAPKTEEMVEIFIPRISGNSDPNLIIVINGKNYVLPRGKSSRVPKAVAEEYERSQRAQHKVDNAIFEMVERARQQALAAGIK